MDQLITALMSVIEALGPSGLVVLLGAWLILLGTDTLSDIREERERRAATRQP